jgi:hypothetical protein
MRSRHLLLACLSFLTFATDRAFADTNWWGILSGEQLVWDGTGVDAGAPNLNQLYVGPGQLAINGYFFKDVSGQLVTQTVGTSARTWNFSFAADTSGAQAANTAYYVYAANYYYNVADDAGVGQVVISTTAPTSRGDPTSALAWTPDGGHLFSTSEALFLGSYVTDTSSSHSIVPFLKKGDEVILSAVGGTTLAVGGTPWGGGVTFGTGVGISYPWVQEIIMSTCFSFDGGIGGGPCSAPPIPLTASALLIDFAETDQDTVQHDVRVLNPNYAWMSSANMHDCQSQPQYELNATPGQGTALYNHARIKTATIDAGYASGLADIWVGGCILPAQSDYIVHANYAGYVEIPHHIGN